MLILRCSVLYNKHAYLFIDAYTNWLGWWCSALWYCRALWVSEVARQNAAQCALQCIGKIEAFPRESWKTQKSRNCRKIQARPKSLICREKFTNLNPKIDFLKTWGMYKSYIGISGSIDFAGVGLKGQEAILGFSCMSKPSSGAPPTEIAPSCPDLASCP